jgi:hypothetical protein
MGGVLIHVVVSVLVIVEFDDEAVGLGRLWDVSFGGIVDLGDGTAWPSGLLLMPPTMDLT